MGPRTVICDDDAVVRSVVAHLASEAGLDVVAEADGGGDVLELVHRFDIEVVVLDLSMGAVSGNAVVETLSSEPDPPLMVVFSAYVGDGVDLVAHGVSHVIEKPDLDGLEAALVEVAAEAARRDAAAESESESEAEVERRDRSRKVALVDPVWSSPSGIEPAAELRGRLGACTTGDAVLAVAVGDVSGIRADHGDLLADDCVLEVGRALRSVARTQDLVLEEPGCEGFVVLLRGGDARAATAVWERLSARLDRHLGFPPPVGAWAPITSSVSPAEARARAVGAAASEDEPGLRQA